MNIESEQRIQNGLKEWEKVSTRTIHFSVIFGVLQGVTLVIQAYFIAQTLQQVIIEQSRESLVMNLLLVFSLTCLRGLFHYWKEAYSFKAGKDIRQQVRHSALRKMAELGPVFLKTKPEGYWNTLLVDQVEQLQDYYSRYLPQRSLIAFIPLIMLIVVFPQSWIAGLILLLTAPLIPLFMILVGKGAARASQQHNFALQRLTSYFADRLSGLSTLKLFYRYQSELEGVTKISEDFQRRTMSVLKRAFLSSAVLEFFSAVSIALLAVYLGFSFLEYLDSGFYGVKVTLFSAMFILLLAPEFYQPLRELGSFYHAKAQAVAAAEALIDLLTTESSQNTPSCEVIDFDRPLVIEATDLVILSHQQAILLGPVSFSWKTSEKVGIVGRSGSGKTSLINAILGFLPYEGCLKINGVELNSTPIECWHQQIGWLGQLPKLFSASLKENLLVGDPNATDETLQQVLEHVELPQWQEQLDKTISEKNAGISVGQAQRMSLARMLLKEHQLLLLDEPTAALDEQTRKSIWQQLLFSMDKAGGLIVTHKSSEMQSMDRIWIVESGQVIHQGTYEELSSLLTPFIEEAV